MSNIALLQTVLMFTDSLPVTIEYDSLVKECFKVFGEPLHVWNGNSTIKELPLYTANGPRSTVAIQNARISIERTKIDNPVTELEELVQALDRIAEKIGVDYSFRYRLGIVMTIQDKTKKIKNHAAGALNEDKLDSPEFNVSYLEKSTEGNVKVNKWEVINYDANQEQSVLVIDTNSDMNNEFYLGRTKPSDVYNNLKGVLMNAYERFDNTIS